MLPLHYSSRWQIASIIFLIVVLAAALLPAVWFWGDKVSALSWFESVDKWLHCATFLALSIWFVGMYRKRSFWRVALGLLAFGAAIEVCQRMISYRTADMIDIAADAVGIIAGLAIGYAGAAGWCLRVENRLLTQSAGTVD